MDQQFQFDEGLLRQELSKMDTIIPGVSNESYADTVIGLIQGKLQLKQVQGFSDDSMEAVYAVAYNAVQAGQFDKGEKLFRFLTLFDNSEEKYWSGLGLCLFTRKQYDAALQAYSMSSMLNIDDPRTLMRVAECHLALGNVETAEGALEGAIEIAGDRPEMAAASQHAHALLELLRNRG